MALLVPIKNFFSRMKAAQAVARSVSVLVRPNTSTFFNKAPMDFEQATKDGYQALVWVYRCVNAYSTAVSSVPWKAYKVNSKGVYNHLPGHPLEVLLNNPNKFFGRKEFFDAWTAHLFLAGRAYWEKVMVSKKTAELWTLRPDWVTPTPNKFTFISDYVFKPPSAPPDAKIIYPTNEICEFKFINPLDPYGYQSPLSAAARTMHTENAAIGWNQSMLDNAAVPGGIFNIPVQTTTKAQRDELRGALEAEYGAENRFQTMILWGGIKWERLAFSPQDMQFLEQRRLNKYEICSIFGVPPQMVGAQEDPTYSNYAVARLSFWEDSVVPLLDWIAEKASQSLGMEYGPDIKVKYDLTNVPAMREAFTQQITNAFKLWQMKWPINEINRRLGLGMTDVPWGDQSYEQINQVPMEDLGTPAVLDTTPSGGQPNTTDPNAPVDSPKPPKTPKKPAPKKDL